MKKMAAINTPPPRLNRKEFIMPTKADGADIDRPSAFVNFKCVRFTRCPLYTP